MLPWMIISAQNDLNAMAQCNFSSVTGWHITNFWTTGKSSVVVFFSFFFEINSEPWLLGIAVFQSDGRCFYISQPWVVGLTGLQTLCSYMLTCFAMRDAILCPITSYQSVLQLHVSSSMAQVCLKWIFESLMPPKDGILCKCDLEFCTRDTSHTLYRSVG